MNEASDSLSAPSQGAFSALFDNTAIGIKCVDLDGRIIDVNRYSAGAVEPIQCLMFGTSCKTAFNSDL